MLDDNGDVYLYLQKAPVEFFERIVAILPMHIGFLSNKELVRTLEVLVKRELGSDRLFQNYIYMRIERKVLQFSIKEYCRCVRALADKGHGDDR